MPQKIGDCIDYIDLKIIDFKTKRPGGDGYKKQMALIAGPGDRFSFILAWVVLLGFTFLKTSQIAEVGTVFIKTGIFNFSGVLGKDFGTYCANKLMIFVATDRIQCSKDILP